MKPALLVQDIQNVWLYEPDSNQGLRRSVEKRLDLINEAIAWFRRKKLPIIVGYTIDKEIGLLPGKWSFEVPPTVKIRKTDPKVTKLHASAFANPDLGALLRGKGCDTLVIVGLSASGCVLATYFGALDWDIQPYVLKGCVASAKEKHVRFAEEICDTVTLKDLDCKLRRVPSDE
jgi:nicotinamidase-related amidase